MQEMQDVDPVETREWLDALGSVLRFEGEERAGFLLDELVTEGRQRGVPVPYSAKGHAGQSADRVAHRPGGEHLAAPRRLGHARRHVHDVADDVVLSHHEHLTYVEADT